MRAESPPTGARGHALLVGSSGGHLTQLMALRPWWEGLDRTWCTFRTPDAIGHLRDESDVRWAFFPTTRNLLNLLRNTRLAWSVVRRTRPDTIITTGAGVALPFFVLGKLYGATTVYIEVYDRIETATLTGRLCRPFTDIMCVQWQEQLKLYRDATLIGPLL
jgi:UDP-N-acetylglucosamine:LPS N-acetylglucosamine transferase